MKIQIPTKDFMSDGYIPRIGVDRLVLSVVLNKDYYTKGGRKIGPEDMELYNLMVSMLFQSDRLKHYSSKVKKGSSGKAQPHYWHSLSVSGRNLMTVRHGYKGGNPYFRFEMNPDKLTDSDFAIVCTEIWEILPPDFDRTDFLMNMAVSEVELLIELPGTMPEEVVTLVPAKHHPKVVYEETTEYDGSRGSRISVVKYDKAKELREEHGVLLDHPLTRIEVRVRERGLSLLKLLGAEEVAFYKGIFCHLRHETGHAGSEARAWKNVGNPARCAHVDDQERPRDALQEGEVSELAAKAALVYPPATVGKAAGVPAYVRGETTCPPVQLIARSGIPKAMPVQLISRQFKGVQ